ncbi:hypothetical protein ACFX13_034103 [Malus domestica]
MRTIKAPSWVAFTDTVRLIGEAATNQAPLNAKRTISDVKRLIGRKRLIFCVWEEFKQLYMVLGFEDVVDYLFDDPEVQRDIKFLRYKAVNEDGKPYMQVNVKGETKVFSPEEISAVILGKMKETAGGLPREENQRRRGYRSSLFQ